jgi:hypothetical protein
LELNDALCRISEIREHIGRTEVFRGYRALPIAASGVVALFAGALQPLLVVDPAAEFGAWLGLWILAAVLSVALCAVEMTVRVHRTTSALERERVRRAVVRFLPAVVTGALLTFVLGDRAPESRPLLPGLWAILMGLGISASLPMLPRRILGVAAFYLGAGLLAIAFARDVHAFSPLAMGLPFGAGQLAAAAVLAFPRERES